MDRSITRCHTHRKAVLHDGGGEAKLRWELGGLSARGDKSELADSYFLGAPLPLEGQLTSRRLEKLRSSIALRLDFRNRR